MSAGPHDVLGSQSRLGRILFPIFSLLNHSCVANAQFEIREEILNRNSDGAIDAHEHPENTAEFGFKVEVRAKQNIKVISQLIPYFNPKCLFLFNINYFLV